MTENRKNMAQQRLFGVLSPAVTPFRQDLSVAPERWLQHARWLLDNGCTGLAVFGTTSEANSLTIEERMSLLERLAAQGIADRLMPGTGCCSFVDSVKLTSHAVQLGCAGVLMLPPFYYKGVSEEGLFRGFSEVIERVGDARLQMYLYHIPQMTQVPITHDLIERLLKRYPGTVAGIKDSSGDWNNTKAMLERFRNTGFDIFVGSETALLANMRGGGVGCISATANINPARIRHLFDHWSDPNADALQAEITAVRNAVMQYPVIPASKATIARFAGDAEWGKVRPPLVELNASQCDALAAALDTLGFAMPGFAEASLSR
jgi:4-hydroxy-tetrahydrodipicolinate synthase